MKTLKYILILVSALWFSACGTHDHGSDTHNHDHTDNSSPEQNMDQEEHDEVVLTVIQTEKIGLSLTSWQERNLRAQIKVAGSLELPPQNRATLTPLIAGSIQEINVLEGDEVNKGDVIVRLVTPELLKLQQDYISALNKFTVAKAEYQRQQTLANKEVSSQKQFELAKSNYMIAKAESESLAGMLKMLSINPQEIAEGNILSSVAVRSPISGYIRNLQVNLGSWVHPEDEMMQIIDNHHIHIDMMVYQRDMDRIAVGQQVLFQLLNRPGKEYEATVYAIGKSVENEEKTIKVHADIDNPEGDLVPGMYVDARIITGSSSDVVLPENCIVTDRGLDYIFVLNEEESDEDHRVFHKVQVLSGIRDAGFVEVTPLVILDENPQIVETGSFFLMAESKKGEDEGGGHHH